MRKVLLLQFFLACFTFAIAQTPLKNKINEIAKDAKGEIGVSMIDLQTGRSFSINGDKPLVMQSTFKFPIAVAVLHKVDKGSIKLEDKLRLTKADLPENYSPLRDKHPDGNVDVTIRELLDYMLIWSDNDACDILLNRVCSKAEVEQYMHQLGGTSFRIRATEMEMKNDWQAQFTDVCTVTDMAKLFRTVRNGEALSANSTEYIIKTMEKTEVGKKRIKGLLPANTVVAHRTGTSATDTRTGISPATNDGGIITLPNGKQFILVVFVSNAKADTDTREAVIARIAKVVYDDVVSGKLN
ncbi:class A beta-lactamase [Mucilaginibacter sp. 21P]|uniref:class A beta-lactamase n=1 Tax=Mucilaginibacter sp. 21P TaxID=2778902 RepID=UPI001C562730|nr:class A beta-lactamase [Mucilaginibacter sp. 21P]QXV64066.1 class A beta-lactamase [Mucilaginibacter sp. 21P]